MRIGTVQRERIVRLHRYDFGVDGRASPPARGSAGGKAPRVTEANLLAGRSHDDVGIRKYRAPLVNIDFLADAAEPESEPTGTVILESRSMRSGSPVWNDGVDALLRDF